MCELLGMTANVPTDICFSFTGLIQRSGVTDQHRDGWGITFYEGKGTRTFKDANPGIKSEVAKLVQSYPIRSCLVISHIRKANRGRVCLENTHPFERELYGVNWTFAHNGQLKGIKKRALKYFFPVGSTDSEHAFCWLLDQIKSRYRGSAAPGLTFYKFLEQKLQDLSELGVLNVLMADGKYLYAYSSKQLHWITRKAPFKQAKLLDKEVSIDFKDVTTDKDIVTVISTNPLTGNEQWSRMDNRKLYVFYKGRLKFPGI